MSSKLRTLPNPSGESHRETLHFNSTKQEIKGQFWAFKFIDKDTKQYVFYIPSLDLSGYGETLAKAQELLKFSLDQYSGYLCSLSQQEVQKELRDKGWVKNTFRNKDYSKVTVDSEGNLQNFNAVDGKVERMAFAV